MARPRKTADEKRTERFNLRYTVTEREAVRDLAVRYGLSEMEFQRNRVLGTPLPAQGSGRADPLLIAALNSYAVELARIGNNLNQLTAATHQGREFSLYWREIGDKLQEDLAAVRSALDASLEEMAE